MSDTVGGPIESVSVKGRIFAVAADSDAKRKLGGTSNKVEMNGNGTARIIKTAEGWELSDINVEINDTRGDQEHLQSVADGKEFVPCLITLCSGANYSGKGIITDMPEAGTMNSTGKISLSGPGKLKKQ